MLEKLLTDKKLLTIKSLQRLDSQFSTFLYSSKVALSCGKLREHMIMLNVDSSVPNFFSPARYRSCASCLALFMSTFGFSFREA